MAADFTLSEFRRHLEQFRDSVLWDNRYASNKYLFQVLAIIDAMAPEEREKPELIGPDQVRRIAQATGIAQETVQGFLYDFGQCSDELVKLGRKMTNRIWEAVFFAAFPGARHSTRHPPLVRPFSKN